MKKRWINGTLGLVVVLLPFLSITETAMTWSLMCIGLAIMIGNLWGIYKNSPSDDQVYVAEIHA